VNHLLRTWEDLDDLRARFPSFQLEDELDFEAGRDVMCRDAHMSGAGKIGNIFPIGNICPIGNVFPIGNI
jgi:hypothetical protein